MVAKSTSWTNEDEFGIRGCKDNSYVVTNGSVAPSATGNVEDIWDPAFSIDVTAGLTQGTTLIGLANVDNAVPAVGANIGLNNVYGPTVLNRPIIIDEVGVRVLLSTGVNFYNWQLQCNLMWIDQADWVLADFDGTCASYPASNYLTGTVSDPYRLQWGPDRLYNAAVGLPDEVVTPSGHGPNALVIYANADAETAGIDALHPLAPVITDSQAVDGIWRPPKDSVILDPEQAVVLNVNELLIQQAGFNAATPIAFVGIIEIAAWIRFRQPMAQEQIHCLNENVNGVPVY